MSKQLKYHLIDAIKELIEDNLSFTMLASWFNADNSNLEPGYLIHRNGSFFCVGMVNAQEQSPGSLGYLEELSESELLKIYHNLFDSTGFIADLSDFSDFFQSALPGVIPSQFFKWCETGRYL